ncbi:hypothetical protein JXA88_06145, partial [Candidatus Fermentibacteria bacterium]|nr:hypothetical protein [Candidatus Fermentibacteria bacterium]
RGVYGGATATSGAAWGGYFTSASTDGRGVYGRALATSGTTSGVYGTSDSTAGRGVYGGATAASGAAYGGYFTSVSTAGRAVYGWAAATSGTTYGIWGQSNSSDGRGVHGYAAATSGTTYGVYGLAVSPAGFAGYFQGNARVTGNLTVDGTLSGSGMGDITAVIAGTGLTGGATSGNATLHVAVPLALTASNANPIISGTNSSTAGNSPGVRGTSASTQGIGVYGEATATSGVTYGGRFMSASPNGCGVTGSASACGGDFTSSSAIGTGVFAHASATTGDPCGVVGRSDSPGGYGVYFIGGLAGSGTKSCVVQTSRGPTLMYCQESPENWFEDFGEGQLVDGRCHVELDPLFLETVTIDAANPMKVFVELHDESCEGVAVKKGLTGFDVVERNGGGSNGTFDYRVVAKRRGFEEKRLDYCASAERDSYLYPELREQERLEMEEERLHHEE